MKSSRDNSWRIGSSYTSSEQDRIRVKLPAGRKLKMERITWSESQHTSTVLKTVGT